MALASMTPPTNMFFFISKFFNFVIFVGEKMEKINANLTKECKQKKNTKNLGSKI
jgi:hypothetical protein